MLIKKKLEILASIKTQTFQTKYTLGERDIQYVYTDITINQSFARD
jgi:hypothetical protein